MPCEPLSPDGVQHDIATEVEGGTDEVEITFRSYHYEYEDGVSDNHTLQIRGWGFDRNSNPMLTRIDNFPAFCFVELPPFLNGQPFSWNSPAVSMFVDSLRYRMGEDYGPVPYVPDDFGYHKKLYYYSGNMRYPMVRLSFKTVKAMRAIDDLLKYIFYIHGLGEVKVNVWETEIDPIRKFLSACSPEFSEDPQQKMQLTHTCWSRCKARKTLPGEGISTLEQEYVINWSTIRRVPDEECGEWQIPCPGAMAFDIETYSNRHQMFPDKYNEAHVAYMISCTYQRLASTKSKEKPIRYRYGIVLGDCNEIPPEKFANTILFKVDTEEELIRMMGAIVIYHDPEIITGYNILSYDYPYLNARLGRAFQKWPKMSRLKGRECFIKSNSWSSGAYGHNDINMLICPGRISVDMLNVTRRDYKMSTYSLNSVAKFFVNKTKFDITAKQMFVIYELLIAGLKAGPGTPEHEEGMRKFTEVMLYCIQDSELVLDIMDKTNWWVGALVMAGIVGVNPLDLSTGGQQIRCISQLYHVGAKMGYVLNTRVAPQIPFEGGAVQPPTPGLHKRVITIDFTSLYPSIMVRYNICYTTLVPDIVAKDMNDEFCNVTPPINCSYEHDPDEEDIDEEEKEERYRARGEKGTYQFKYMKKDVIEGLVPRIVKHLCEERSKVKKRIWAEEQKGDAKDDMKLITMDKEQNGLKVSANSFFGFLGVREGGKRPLIEGAMSITAWGRDMITKVMRYLVDTYNATIIYGDTDSAMISMPEQIECDTDMWYWGERIAKEVTALFEKPVNMEFEKAFLRMLSLMKKKYAGVLGEAPDPKVWGLPRYVGGYMKNGVMQGGQVMYGDLTSEELGEKLGKMYKKTKSGEPDLFIRGVLTARRDNCKWSRDIYGDTLKKTIMDSVFDIAPEDSFVEVVNNLCDYVEPLVSGNVPAEDLCISRSLGANYKSTTYFMKVFSDELRKEGKPAQAGDRLEYIVMNRPQFTHLGKRMMLKDTYAERYGTDKEEKIDYGYYLEKQIQSPVDQVVSIAFKDIIDRLNDVIAYRPSNRHGWTRLDELIKMMVRMTSKGIPINSLREAVTDSVAVLKTTPILPPPPKLLPILVIEDDEEDIMLPCWQPPPPQNVWLIIE
jgi:DNA polymerase elongation subunit (family B)